VELTVANTLDYYNTAKITAIKNFIVQAHRRDMLVANISRLMSLVMQSDEIKHSCIKKTG
jgi:hypothetical protein